MTTSPQSPDRAWPRRQSEWEYDLLAQQPLPAVSSPHGSTAADLDALVGDPVDQAGEAGPGPTVGDDEVAGTPSGSSVAATWDVDHDAKEARVGEYAALPGMPGRGVVLTSLLAAGGSAGLDLLLAGGITIFFDLCFVVVCLVGAMGVRRRDLFTTGVLPPLLFAAVVAVVAVSSPGTFGQVGGLTQAFMTGLAQHATGLVAGYAVALATVACRVSVASAG